MATYLAESYRVGLGLYLGHVIGVVAISRDTSDQPGIRQGSPRSPEGDPWTQSKKERPTP